MQRLLLSLVYILTVVATATATPFEEGVAAYGQADYPAAIEYFTQSLNEEGPTAEGYYNLGAAYYKNDELAQAILAFERAYRIAPSDRDIRFNLDLARSQTIDEIEEERQLFISRRFRQMSHWASLTFWRAAGLTLFAIFLVGLFHYLRGKRRSIRQLGFYGGIAALFLSVVVNLLAYRSYQFTHDDKEAILTADIITVKSSPDASAKDIVVVHSGLKVETLQQLSGYVEVKLPDGTIGWIPQEACQIINNFNIK
ncbi:MAG: tetratricopeptide repeat protein [Porphyromonas sp.]|nr:tetratricopeptide repeat protein [Porphyromonas sp.]